MATTMKRPNSRLSFADEVSYNRDSPLISDLDNSFAESFIIGDRVWLNGIYSARIQYIGEVHFGHGDDWAGLVMDEPIGRHDGSVGGHRYYYCENKKGLFAKLSKLTRVPLRAQESPDSGITTSPTRPPRLRHNSSPSSILKNSSNSTKFHAINTPLISPRQYPEVTFKRHYSTGNSPVSSKSDRSLNDYYYDNSHNYEYSKQSSNRSQSKLNRSNEHSDLNSSRSSPFSRYSTSPTRSSLTSPSLVNLHYARPSRSSTPKLDLTQRSLSSGRQPRIHHIRVELEGDTLDFKKNLKKACSQDLKDEFTKNRAETVIEKALLKLGDFVYVDSSKGLLSGKLRYLGPTEFRDGHWAGVELELPYGKHDGKVEGKRYFTCKKNHGLFAPCHRVFKQRKADPFDKPFKSTRFADDV